MSKLRMTYGSDAYTVELGQPSDPILVDGQSFGYQCADGSCRTDDCMRHAAIHCWGALYETREDALAAGRDVSDAICIWEDVEYVTLSDAAAKAIERSRSHDEVVTLDQYTEDDFETLSVECDGHVFANGVWEFWANESYDPDAQCKQHGCARATCDADHTDMEWRVHMPGKADCDTRTFEAES